MDGSKSITVVWFGMLKALGLVGYGYGLGLGKDKQRLVFHILILIYFVNTPPFSYDLLRVR